LTVHSEKKATWESLKEFTQKVFEKAGLPPKDAELEADALVWANLRGVDSHGVLRIPWYIENIDKGVMNPTPNIQVEKETPATLLLDADRALGPVVTVLAMNRAMEKAKNVGIGWVLIRNTTHQGAMGYYPQMAAYKNMAGIAFVCSPPNMAPYGARVAGVHNSPLAICVPAKRHRPLILDMATSVAAGGKINLAKDKNIDIPEGWALDKEGKPTTDPRQAGALLPFGGPKGSGLAMMFECLSSVMAGNPLLEMALLGKEIGSTPRDQKPEAVGERSSYVPRHIQNSVVAAVDISTFTDVEGYKEHVDSLIDGLKALPKAEGFSEIFVPGEPEERTYDERVQSGIPLPQGTVSNLRSVADRFDIELPRNL